MHLVIPKQNSNLIIFKNAILSLFHRGVHNPANRQDVLDLDPNFIGRDEAGAIKRQTELGRYFDFIHQSRNGGNYYALTPKGLTLAHAFDRDNVADQWDCFMTSIIHHTFGFNNNAHPSSCSPIHPPRVILKFLWERDRTSEEILDKIVMSHWHHPQVIQYQAHNPPPPPTGNAYWGNWNEYLPYFKRKIKDNKFLKLLTEIGIFEKNQDVYHLPDQIRNKYGHIIQNMVDLEPNNWNVPNPLNNNPVPFTDNDFTQGAAIVDDGYVYIISHPSWPGWYKIGKTVNLEQRLATYNTGAPHSSAKYRYEYSRQHDQARILELDFHNQYSYLRPQNASAEWYQVGINGVINLQTLRTLLDNFINSY